MTRELPGRTLSYPSILHWSLPEAMRASTLVIAARTAPVEESIAARENGRLCNFFDVDGIADAVVAAPAEPERHRTLREAARRTVVERFDLRRVCVPEWLRLIQRRGPSATTVLFASVRT
jgi:glycosyltransferase involved in cell wall biosynthesis